MNFGTLWYEDERQKGEYLRKELKLIQERDEAKYLIRICLYKMNGFDTPKETKLAAYKELRECVSMENIEKVVVASTEDCKLGFSTNRYISSVRERVIFESQYHVFEQISSWEDLILFMIEEKKGL